MENLADRGASNITVLNSGEPFPTEGMDDAVRILLVGSTDLIDGGELDWYKSFIDGLVVVAGRESSHGVNIYKNINYLILNGKTPKVPDGTISINNPAFVGQYRWITDAATQADGIFVNFLKRSTSPMPLFWFTMFSQSGKMVVRVPNEKDYIYGGLVATTCQFYNIPMYVGKLATVLTVLQGLFNLVPRMQNPNITLPE